MREWTSSQGLTLPHMRTMQKRLKFFEVSERKQVGDAESMISQEGGRFSHMDDEKAEL
ncbi:hypothetical protein F5Y00DRAFT_228592 [Daldinia vernicosa]|uniref:uncharacterized protein n=1 Tax=Daldinia vernicosa TaxID=114800 RepID=UPI002007C9C6|nr:uncharacterized protein F5Y00DRAFT_228592 [Daldinia vernicosa]KAI0852082.1 hypothetical protein F5Y00DRAFT_228592 [Daldinia vernicosa]